MSTFERCPAHWGLGDLKVVGERESGEWRAFYPLCLPGSYHSRCYRSPESQTTVEFGSYGWVWFLRLGSCGLVPHTAPAKPALCDFLCGTSNRCALFISPIYHIKYFKISKCCMQIIKKYNGTEISVIENSDFHCLYCSVKDAFKFLVSVFWYSRASVHGFILSIVLITEFVPVFRL